MSDSYAGLEADASLDMTPGFDLRTIEAVPAWNLLQ